MRQPCDPVITLQRLGLVPSGTGTHQSDWLRLISDGKAVSATLENGPKPARWPVSGVLIFAAGCQLLFGLVGIWPVYGAWLN